MAAASGIPYLPASLANLPLSIQVLATGLLFLLIATIPYNAFSASRPYREFPVISLSERGLSPKASWKWHGRETVSRGVSECKDQPFQIITGMLAEPE
jgi:hypothetical protein